MPAATSALKPHFWRTPIRYLRWCSHERPALFFATVLGGIGPLLLLTVPGYRKMTGYEMRPAVPMTYPGEFCGDQRREEGMWWQC